MALADVEPLMNGWLELMLPYHDPDDLVRDILRHSDEVEVISNPSVARLPIQLAAQVMSQVTITIDRQWLPDLGVIGARGHPACQPFP